MPVNNIKYLVNTATVQEIGVHLEQCSADFLPPLAERVNIGEYSKKIHKKSVRFEAWADDKLVGLISAYFNDDFDRSAFVTSVSVLKGFTGRGIASGVLNICVAYARQNFYKEINLEVNKASRQAIRFYEKFNFVKCERNGDILLMKLKIDA